MSWYSCSSKPASSEHADADTVWASCSFRLYETSEYTDLLLTCGKPAEHFHVHRNIVLGQSSVLKSIASDLPVVRRPIVACHSLTPLKETTPNVIYLADFDPKSARMFVRTLYYGDYEAEIGEDQSFGRLIQHATMYEMVTDTTWQG